MILRIASIILFLLTILSAYGGRINPQYLMFPSALTLALPYFAIATAVTAVGWLCSGRLFMAAAGVLVLVVSWGPVSEAVPMRFASKPDDESRTFKLLTYNILHGWDQQNPDIYKGDRSFRYVLGSGADLVGLQETANLDDKWEIPSFQGALRDSILAVYPYRAGTTGCDLKVLSKYPVRLIREYLTFSHFVVSMPWGELNWINVHLSSFRLTAEERGVMREVVSVKGTEAGLKEMKGSIREKLKKGFISRAERARELRELISQTRGALIVSGDFNDVPASYAYRLVKGEDLEDAYTETSFGPVITYNRYGFWFHLDQILYRPDPLKALKVTKGRLKSSDHYPLMAEFEWK